MRDQQFVGDGGEPLTQRGRLRGDVVRAAGHDQLVVLGRAPRQSGQHRDALGSHQFQRGPDLQLLDVLGQVTAGHALVDVLVAGQRRELLDAGLDVVAGDPFPGGDRRQIDGVGACGGDLLVGGDRVVGDVHAQIALGAQDRDPQLPFQHDLALGRPEVGHGRRCVPPGQDIRDHAGEGGGVVGTGPFSPTDARGGAADTQPGSCSSPRWANVVAAVQGTATPPGTRRITATLQPGRPGTTTNTVAGPARGTLALWLARTPEPWSTHRLTTVTRTPSRVRTSTVSRCTVSGGTTGCRRARRGPRRWSERPGNAARTGGERRRADARQHAGLGVRAVVGGLDGCWRGGDVHRHDPARRLGLRAGNHGEHRAARCRRSRTRRDEPGPGRWSGDRHAVTISAGSPAISTSSSSTDWWSSR